LLQKMQSTTPIDYDALIGSLRGLEPAASLTSSNEHSQPHRGTQALTHFAGNPPSPRVSHLSVSVSSNPPPARWAPPHLSVSTSIEQSHAQQAQPILLKSRSANTHTPRRDLALVPIGTFDSEADTPRQIFVEGGLETPCFFQPPPLCFPPQVRLDNCPHHPIRVLFRHCHGIRRCV
jgi:hypothetical protein